MSSTDLRALDFFCGMGGSSTGLTRAGFNIRLAANHWDRAIETHSANHPNTDHWNADLSAYDMKCLPKADVLWASPICTEVSQAGGRQKRTADLDLFEDESLGSLPDAAYERTRITFWEVIRAVEVQRFPIILIENVVEAAAWELFDLWLDCMMKLGYHAQFVSVSAAHIGSDTNPHAPQWRDRLYIVFNRTDVRRPDVEPRPVGWCMKCDDDVPAMQAWKKPGRRIGKYRQQYVYVCPKPSCRGNVVEPYVLPAAAAIDWTNLGTRIGDREKPLAPATMRRIQAGLDSIGNPAIVAAAGNTYERPGSGYVRAWPAMTSPVMARTGTAGDGLVSAEPFITEQRNHSHARPAGADPLATFTAGGFHHELTVPPGAFIHKHHGGLDYARPEHMSKPVSDPYPTIVTQVNNSLVIPYRKGNKPHRAGENALSTMSTVDTHTMLTPPSEPVTIEDCLFRMLTPREAANAQAFPTEYVIKGTKGEQQMQAGNAVATNVACWLGEAAMAVL